ncbi:flagellar motor protein MotS [Virgibacillus sp. DJP39]|uniref:flagellar motor protein MotS n=1 Tax=Virgibacillus sp. DJP39 TaxID=3409790 RepID=UPI003BB491D3
MKRRPIKRRKSSGAPKWMVTYSDMITLILVFFILLFSMSQINSVKFEVVSESFKNRMIFDFYPSSVPMESPAETNNKLDNGRNSNEIENPSSEFKPFPNSPRKKEDTLNNLMTEVEQYLAKNDLNNVISASRSERGVVLVLQELILFNSGEAKILSSGKPFLNKMGSLLMKIPNEIKVEGHTDSQPMSSFRYPSNWELSGARASSVVRYLIEENDFDKSRFTIVGYSDTKPLLPNDSDENMEKNRRVEIVIIESKS